MHGKGDGESFSLRGKVVYYAEVDAREHASLKGHPKERMENTKGATKSLA